MAKGAGYDGSRTASPGICTGAPTVQHKHIRPANHISKKYAYADDLAIMHADGDWQAVEGALSKDMATLDE